VAEKEAKRWIEGLNLRRVGDTVVDLRVPAESLNFQGDFRVTVLQEAKRLLKKRGAYVIMPDEA